MTEKEDDRDSRAITLSVVVPCFNEEKTLKDCLEKVLDIADEHLILDIIIVDDRSDDESFKIASDFAQRHEEISVYRHGENLGKGAALRTGFQMARGDVVAVQDADLEYDPKDLKRLLRPLIENYADVVFGSRFLSPGVHRVLYFWHYLGNRFLTLISNMFTDLNLTDMETCYKVFRRQILKDINLKSNRFGFEPEFTAKISKMRLRIYEVPISYSGRTYSEGKKITWKDGIVALCLIFWYRFFD
jgi:glycosyltransferase involved in cell wall biosynthesis